MPGVGRGHPSQTTNTSTAADTPTATNNPLSRSGTFAQPPSFPRTREPRTNGGAVKNPAVFYVQIRVAFGLTPV